MNLSKRVGSILWVHKDGRTFSLNLNDKSSSKKTGPIGSISGTMKSPMPGKILKVESKIGQAVRAGQTICTIEAMKMEYALKAPFVGKIKEVFKKVGDQVLLDEKIMTLEPQK